MSDFATRLIVALLVLSTASVAAAPAARADAAGPTDYNTEIVSIEPATNEIEVEMIGGDAFLRLRQLEPVEIIVLGYEGEPYLRFEPGGTVFENLRSPAVWLNEDRYGTEEQQPSYMSAEAVPQWRPVATGGEYSWHDHRSHWMNPQKPPGAEAGDQVLEATVPLKVGDRRVTITVASYLLQPPSTLPVALGVVVALFAGALSPRAGRTGRAGGALIVALGALALGATAVRSVPAETGPSQLLWLLPAIAAACALMLLLVRNRTATTVYLDGLAVAAGGLLAAWAFTRRGALQRALIPSDAPASIDRFGITIALVLGVGVLTHGIVGLLRPQRLIEIDDQ